MLLSMYLLFRVQSLLAMLFCTLCFRKKFHRKKNPVRCNKTQSAQKVASLSTAVDRFDLQVMWTLGVRRITSLSP